MVIKVPPRSDRPDWEEYGMLFALVAAQRSPDPYTQVGASIFDKDNKLIGVGYNGLPREIDNNSISWARESEDNDPLKTKYPFVVHSEANAIQNCTRSCEGATLFVTLHPCADCMKLIIQAGIKQIYYLENKYPDTWSVQAAIIMAEEAGVELIDFDRFKFPVIDAIQNILMIVQLHLYCEST